MPKRDGQKRDADVLLRVVIALRRIKAERDLSDRAMAIQSNVSYAFFKDIMDNGGNPSILVLDDMARRLGVTLQDLLKDYTPAEKRSLLRAWEAGELRREGLRAARVEAAAKEERDAKSAARGIARRKTSRASARKESK
jgi:transcriptional regulator with XRE-family HTH domain